MLNIKKRIISINFHNEKIKYFKYILNIVSIIIIKT